MRRLPSERAQWLARNIVPHETAIRAWLVRRAFDLDIDDIIQEMYARLAGLETVEDIRNPRQYAFQAAFSILVNLTRHARVIPMVAVGDFEELGLSSPEPSPEQHAEARAELKALEQALQSLPDACREAFLLRRVDGLSQKEVAAKMGISEKTVEKYMANGVRFLIQHYGRGGKAGAEVSMDPGESASAQERSQYRK
jgi:RNA polymerase sigma factor (sigma-70 family)